MSAKQYLAENKKIVVEDVIRNEALQRLEEAKANFVSILAGSKSGVSESFYNNLYKIIDVIDSEIKRK